MDKYKHELPDEVIRKEYERARSGAAGKHGDRRLKRKRTRAAIKSDAIKHG